MAHRNRARRKLVIRASPIPSTIAKTEVSNISRIHNDPMPVVVCTRRVIPQNRKAHWLAAKDSKAARKAKNLPLPDSVHKVVQKPY